MLLADEDVGDGALVGYLLEGILDSGAIVYGPSVRIAPCIVQISSARSHTDLVELDDVRLRAELAKQALGRLAVRAVGFGKDSCNRNLFSDHNHVWHNSDQKECVPTALLSIMSCALVFAAMMVFGLDERALEKKLRRIFRLGNVVGCCW